MTRATTVRLVAVTALVLLLIGIAVAEIPLLSFFAKLALGLVTFLALAWLAFKAYQAFLWRVSRRLAFSYFLIGVVPIPMVLVLATGVVYVAATFVLGYLYSQSLAGVAEEQGRRAEAALAAFAAHREPGSAQVGNAKLDYYRAGQWVGGAGTAPKTWPAWLTQAPEEGSDALEASRFVAGENGEPTLAVAAQQGDLGVVAVFAGDLAGELRRRSQAWVTLMPSDDDSTSAEGSEGPTITIDGKHFRFKRDREEARREKEARKAFFDNQAGLEPSTDLPAAAGETPATPKRRLWDQAFVAWVELEGPLRAFASGDTLSSELFAEVRATPRLLGRRIFRSRSELNGAMWAGLGAIAVFLSAIYGLAVMVALYMIFGLSTAVNRLSKATAAVQAGNFAVRIPVRRTDQVGALQQSFNQMAIGLERSVATAAQKEVLEKELEIAREIQESLLPSNLPQGERVEFATVFEPSAAIGGDYFDILRLDDRRLAIVIADVSGHGLASGLRMAMLKAGLQILIEEERNPSRILERLDALVRGQGDQRFFVTATLSILDLETGKLEITNAGHPPTYLIRQGEVRELLYPGTPLGTLGKSYGRGTIELTSGDLVVWLSDGFIEARNPQGDPMGYGAMLTTFAAAGKTAYSVKAHLLAEVERYTEGCPADDDRTLVVMQYHGALL